MKKHGLISLALLLASLLSTGALAEETSREAPPTMLARLKTGFAFPHQNTTVKFLQPVGASLEFLGGAALSLGAEASYQSGSGSVDFIQGPNLGSYTTHKSRILALGTLAYNFNYGSARIATGVKAGALFFSQSNSLAVGLSSTTLPADESGTRFTAGPAVNVDLPLKGQLFANLGGDYMITEHDYEFGSMYFGLGLNF